jgi:hypothetical protein
MFMMDKGLQHTQVSYHLDHNERNGQNMIIEAAIIKLYAPWVHSLKEKRMTVKSLIAKTKNKFMQSIYFI